MRHARPDDLDRVEALMEQLRKIEGLKEKKRGSFYCKSKGFLHFHEHEGEIIADVKGPEDWERFPAHEKKWPALMRRVKQLAK